MNSLTVKILAALVSVLIVTMLGSQIYYAFHDKHDTEEAVLTTIDENIPFEGVIVRDESVIRYDGGGVIDYLYSDGSKVTENNTVAEVYSSDEQISSKNKAAFLDEEITNLQKAQNPGTTNYVQPETIKARIDNQYKQMLTDVTKKDYSELEKSKISLSFVMNIYDVVTNSETGFDDRINELKSRIDTLNQTVEKPVSEIKSPKTGYFVSYADGYEGKLTTENADEMTAEDVNEVVNSELKSPDGAVGKVFDNYSCKIVGVLDVDSRVAEGAYLRMMLSASKNVYDVYVESVKPCEDDDSKNVVVFSCDRLDEKLAKSRVTTIQLIFDEYIGVKVPRSAIRFQGEQKGVYVILGKDITFKKIDVIYEGDDFVLSKNTSDEDCLLLYDQILLEVVSSDDVTDSTSTADLADSSSGGANGNESSENTGQ